MPHVVRDQKSRSGADRRGQDRHVLGVREFAGSFTVVRCRTVDLERHATEELLEERRGLREFGS
jgi:hypothetical protein